MTRIYSFTLLLLLVPFGFASMAHATSNVCDPSYLDTTYQSYIVSSPTQQAVINQTISDAIQSEQAIQSTDTSTALSGLYGQLEASFQASILAWKEARPSNEIEPDPIQQYDLQYANLVIQQLHTLGAVGIGTKFITSDYQNAIATWNAEEAVAKASNLIYWSDTISNQAKEQSISEEQSWYDAKAAAITGAYNQVIATANVPIANTIAVAKDCINNLQSLQKKLFHADVLRGEADYNCKQDLGTMATANNDGSCTVSCPSDYAYASSTRECSPITIPVVPPSTTTAPPSIIAPVVLPTTATITPPGRVVPATVQPSKAPIKLKSVPVVPIQETVATATPTSASTSSTTVPVNPPRESFWTRFFRALNPFSWF